MQPYAWHAHPDVWLLIAVLLGGYVWALRHLGPRHTAPGQPVASRLQKVCWVTGVLTLWVASDWPVHDLSEGYLYSVHMTQHLLMTLVAPPLLLLGTPAWLARELLRPPALYRAVRSLARPFPALVLFNVLIVVTHWPAFVDATLGSELLHFTIHAALFVSAILMWCPVTAALPEARPLAPPAQMLYMFLQSVVPTVPASFLVFAEKPIYHFYVDVPRLWGVSAGEDQRIAGLLMKLGGGLLLWMIIAVLFFKWHSAEEENDRQARHWRALERELDGGARSDEVDWLMKEFRDRVLIPTLVPLGALAIIVVVVMNISRVLLALEERSGPNTVTVLAVILSSGILFGFTYFATQGKERSAGSISLMSVAGIMVILAGFVGAEAIHEDEEKERAHAAEEAGASEPDLTVNAFDIGFREKELKIGPGQVRIEMVNTGAISHTLVLDGATGGKKLSTPGSGDKDNAAFELAAGTFTYYCDIAGHRQAGMEGTLIVDPAGPAPGTGAGGGGGGGTPLAIEGADLKFTPEDATAPAGPVGITLKNVGLIQHNLVIEGHPEFKKLDVAPGGSATGTFDAKPGTYVMYCDIVGHRPAGMEAKLTVS